MQLAKTTLISPQCREALMLDSDKISVEDALIATSFWKKLSSQSFSITTTSPSPTVLADFTDFFSNIYTLYKAVLHVDKISVKSNQRNNPQVLFAFGTKNVTSGIFVADSYTTAHELRGDQGTNLVTTFEDMDLYSTMYSFETRVPYTTKQPLTSRAVKNNAGSDTLQSTSGTLYGVSVVYCELENSNSFKGTITLYGGGLYKKIKSLITKALNRFNATKGGFCYAVS